MTFSFFCAKPNVSYFFSPQDDFGEEDADPQSVTPDPKDGPGGPGIIGLMAEPLPEEPSPEPSPEPPAQQQQQPQQGKKKKGKGSSKVPIVEEAAAAAKVEPAETSLDSQVSSSTDANSNNFESGGKDAAEDGKQLQQQQQQQGGKKKKGQKQQQNGEKPLDYKKVRGKVMNNPFFQQTNPSSSSSLLPQRWASCPPATSSRR